MKDKYCLDSVVPFSGINQSHTNRSSTKQTFSFSKSPRFDSNKAPCPVSTYDGKPMLRKHSGTAMGYGKKSDFTKTLAVSPQSNRYKINSLFEKNKTRGKGYSLGKSREVSVLVGRKFCLTPMSTSKNFKTQVLDNTKWKGNWQQLRHRPQDTA